MASIATTRSRTAGVCTLVSSKRKPRKKAAVDPALAGRVRDAFERATGFKARVGPDHVVVEFRDEHELEELAEALEKLAP